MYYEDVDMRNPNKETTMKTLILNVVVTLCATVLGLGVTAGLSSLGVPGFAAGAVGTVAYVSTLLSGVK